MKDYKSRSALALKVIAVLEKLYPDSVALCSLVYLKPHELMIAARLSAQCTDERVNKVTPALFEKYKSISDFAAADPLDIEKYIYSCGFYHSKAADIVGMCKKIEEDFNGIIPERMEDLLSLPGIGRKTANLIRGDIYDLPAVVCDTHCIRISNRLSLSDSKIPEKCEDQLREILPPEKSNDFCHRIVLFGRDFCRSQNPKCDICPLAHICPSRPNFFDK